MDPPLSGSLDGLLEKAALRQAQIQRLKKAVNDEGSSKTFPPLSSITELRPTTTATTSGLSSSTNHGNVTSDPDYRPPEQIKKVFASLADAYRAVDEADSQNEPLSGGSKCSLRSSGGSAKQRSPLKASRTSSSSTVSPNNREKRERDSVAVSPRPVSKVMRSTAESSPVKKIEPTDLPMQARRALFEQPMEKASVETLSVQDKKALFEKSASALSPKKKAANFYTSPTKQAQNSNLMRHALFQEAAAKAQDPTQSSRNLFKSAEFEVKSPNKIPHQIIPLPEPPKEVGAFTKTLQDKLLVQTQAWKNNDLSRKKDEQKDEDMKVLKKRWELMAEEERRASGRQAEIEQLLEKRKAKTAPYVMPGPPPLPLPGSSALHETTPRMTLHHESIHARHEQFPPPPPDLMPPVFDAIARFENPSLKMRKNTPPPPPPFPQMHESVAPLHAAVALFQRRQKLPEEEGVSTAYENTDDHRNVAHGDFNDTKKVDSREDGSSRQKRSMGPKSQSSARVVSWSSDGSDEESERKKSPHHSIVGILKSHEIEDEAETSYVYEHELNEDSDDQSQVSSLESASSVVTQPISLSFYRKTQKESGSGVKRVVVHEPERRNHELTEDEPRRKRLMTFYQQKIDALRGVSSQQQAILVQTTSALNLCRVAPEFQGSIERAECERLLLLAAKKQEAAQSEIKRLTSAVAQMKQGSSIPDQGCHGTLTISSILLHTKDGFVDFITKEEKDFMHYFVILIKHHEKVHATQMVNTVQHLREEDGTFVLPNAITFEDLENDFVIQIEIYAVQARRETVSHEEKYHIKNTTPKKKEKGTSTMKKLLNMPTLLHDGCAKVMGPGPTSTARQEVRATSFGCIGFCLLSLQNVHDAVFKLTKVPDHCALDTTMQMNITCGVALESIEEGFLTIFEDGCGPSAWHRRWCVLKNDSVLMWKYPEDIDTHVEPTNLIECSRPNTFQITLTKPLKLSGAEPREAGPYRYLLAADGKEERFMWQEKLNKVVNHIRAWIPNEKPVESSSRR